MNLTGKDLMTILSAFNCLINDDQHRFLYNTYFDLNKLFNANFLRVYHERTKPFC
ncbi:hypothetical protein LCGC14_0973530 [marine sediment metagenome]|uniref:Uncharacterized protein n=1 Tax=marine sediment metagenome TaxID=412755 RepID=A0A0F9QU46_9ZZZZ